MPPVVVDGDDVVQRPFRDCHDLRDLSPVKKGPADILPSLNSATLIDGAREKRACERDSPSFVVGRGGTASGTMDGVQETKMG
jgi:hypothetical protein